MSRFPIKRLFRKRTPPPPVVPHIIESMDSRRYPLADRAFHMGDCRYNGMPHVGLCLDYPLGPPAGEDLTAWQPRTEEEHMPESDTERLTGPERAADPSPVMKAEEVVGAAAKKMRAAYGRREDADLADTQARLDTREDCPHCRGRGKRLTTNDLLRESIALIEGSEDAVVRTFYEHLLRAAPDLASLFPADLLDPLSPAPIDAPDRTGRGQRDKLVAALAALAQSYDPGNAEGMQILDTHLAAFGRSHAAFYRQDGSVRGATVTEYHYVKQILFATLHDAAGDAWLPEYDAAWDEAYEYAARHMLAAQDSVPNPHGRYPRS